MDEPAEGCVFRPKWFDLGVCGRMASGKSLFCSMLEEELSKAGASVFVANVDRLRRFALWSSTTARHADMRREVARAVGVKAQGADFRLDKKELDAALFGSLEAQDSFARESAPVLIDDAMAERADSGADFALVEWTRLLEDGWLVCCSRAALVVADDSEALRRASANGWDLSFVSARRSADRTDEERMKQGLAQGRGFVKVDNNGSTDGLRAAARAQSILFSGG